MMRRNGLPDPTLGINFFADFNLAYIIFDRWLYSQTQSSEPLTSRFSSAVSRMAPYGARSY
jgi:hypothetical protein